MEKEVERTRGRKQRERGVQGGKENEKWEGHTRSRNKGGPEKAPR